MRLFVAIELDARIKAALAAARSSLSKHDRAVRWVAPDQMHLTLVFLGEVADGRVPDVCEAAKRATGRIAPFDMGVAGSGCFPAGGPVRVVWVGVEDASGGLARCQEAVAGELEAIGFPRESRAFSPHLTLGRVRDDPTRGVLRADVVRLAVAATTQTVESIRVMASELRREGARHTVVAECRLEADS